MKIVICDDEEKHLDYLRVHVEKYMKQHGIKAEFYTATSPSEILESDVVFDFAFLDIQMPEVDGITLTKELKNRNSRVILFFITAFEEYQDEAMDLHIFRFFDKPLDIERLYSGLDRAIEFLNESYIDVYLEKDSKHIKVPVDDIKYVKREN